MNLLIDTIFNKLFRFSHANNYHPEQIQFIILTLNALSGSMHVLVQKRLYLNEFCSQKKLFENNCEIGFRLLDHHFNGESVTKSMRVFFSFILKANAIGWLVNELKTETFSIAFGAKKKKKKNPFKL